MRKIISLLFSLALLLSLMIGTQAQATEELTATVPFEFMVNGVTLPAGDYVIARTLPANPAALMIQSRDGRHAALFMANAEGTSEPKLTFETVDGRHYLRQIGSSFGVRTISSARPQVVGSANLAGGGPSLHKQQ